MATNFEFYLKKMKDSCKEKAVGLCYLMKYSEYLNERGGCIKTCADCIEGFLEYLAQEHIEQPKLTKRERAFCEAFKTGWIAKDESDVVCWYANPPIKGDGMWIETGVPVKTEMQIPIDFWFFDFIKWSDEEPWAVADLLKLDVIEEVQEDA